MKKQISRVKVSVTVTLVGSGGKDLATIRVNDEGTPEVYGSAKNTESTVVQAKDLVARAGVRAADAVILGIGEVDR